MFSITSELVFPLLHLLPWIPRSVSVQVSSFAVRFLFRYVFVPGLQSGVVVEISQLFSAICGFGPAIRAMLKLFRLFRIGLYVPLSLGSPQWSDANVCDLGHLCIIMGYWELFWVPEPIG